MIHSLFVEPSHLISKDLTGHYPFKDLIKSVLLILLWAFPFLGALTHFSELLGAGRWLTRPNLIWCSMTTVFDPVSCCAQITAKTSSKQPVAPVWAYLKPDNLSAKWATFFQIKVSKLWICITLTSRSNSICTKSKVYISVADKSIVSSSLPNVSQDSISQENNIRSTWNHMIS